MVANTINGIIKTYNSIPKVFELKPNIQGYNKLDSSVHYADGFRDVVKPELAENEYKTNLYFDSDNDVYTYNIEVMGEQNVEGYRENIKNYFSNLYVRSLSSSINKTSSDINYLLAIKEEYSDKYKVSKGILTEGVLYENTLNSINTEMLDEFTESKVDELLTSFGIIPSGTHLEKMFSLINYKHETSLEKFAIFNKLSRHFRTKCNKWLDELDFIKIEKAFLMVQQLPNSLSLEESEQIYNEFLQI